MRKQYLASVVLVVVLLFGLKPAVGQTLYSFRCTFGQGVAANWDTGKLKIERTNFGKPTVEIIFDAINVKDGTGRIIGNGGAADLVVISPYPLTLLEVTGGGNAIVTTIFPVREKASDVEAKAVMSRHVYGLAEAIPSQFYGTCRTL